MSNNLKYNYYDVLRKNRPDLFTFIEKDIQLIRLKNQNGPFGSTDEYSSFFQEYFDSITLPIFNDQQQLLRAQGYDYPIDFLKQKMLNNPLYQQLDFSCHADYLTMTNFELFGKKTFYFSDNLIEQLSLTSLDISSEFVEPPFPCCLFVITSPIAIEAFNKIDRNNEKRIDHNTPLSTFVMTRPTDENEGLRKILFVTWHASYDDSYMFAKRELLIRENWDIEDMLKTDWRDIYKAPLSDETELFDESRFFDDGLLFYRILINSILYIGSNDPDVIKVLATDVNKLKKSLSNIKSPSKRKELNRKIVARTSLDSSLAGSKSEAIIIEKKEHSTEIISKIPGSKRLDKRFIVRGHWKRQPYGPESSLRKLIFIKPYFKGPDMAELLNKPYEVK
jgi:hypothetical protein